MISVTHFRSDDPAFEARAQDALAALATRPGFVRGSVGRSIDDERDWVLTSEWANVGSYRRALGNYDVKLRATPLLGEAIDLASSFESLVDVTTDGTATAHASDKA
jgi:heme oxygenase (mycobilin-producing)